MGGIKELTILILSFLYVTFVNGTDDILVGCGGFVKSDVEINYSVIEVRRLESSGLKTISWLASECRSGTELMLWYIHHL